MKRKGLLYLLAFLVLMVFIAPILAQEPEADPPTEDTNVEASDEGESETTEQSGNKTQEEQAQTTESGESATTSADLVVVDETTEIVPSVVSKPNSFDPSNVRLPLGLELRDLPNDKGNAVTLCWQERPSDFKPTYKRTAPNVRAAHLVFLINDTRVIEFDDVKKNIKPMAGSPQYWGFDDSVLSGWRWLLIEGFEPNQEVKMRIGIVPPDLEPSYMAAKSKLAVITKITAELNDAIHNRAFEQLRRKRQEQLDAFSESITASEEALAALGYTMDEAKSEWDRARASVYYYPTEYTVTTKTGWYNSVKSNNLILGIIYGAVVLSFIARARRDKNLFIRRINGLEAVDEAIGRATEMGKPILYLTGMTTLADLATLAAINILGEVAKKIAEYESTLIVPCRDPVVMTVNQETVKEAYTEAGRPDRYNEDMVFFLTEDQFSYTASVNGIMLRDKPAANFFMGYYYAESLLLAETGAMTGAIQIAGTDSLAQLPFFITACDYTLIGEELYAASAYLSREPLLLGSLKGQDVGKLFLMIVILFGTLLVSLGVWLQVDGLDFVHNIFAAL